jgi:hypothetical protein
MSSKQQDNMGRNPETFFSNMCTSEREAEEKAAQARKPKPFITEVESCARCGKNHESVFFKVFSRENPRYSHYAECPETKEPILMRIINT